MTTPVLPAALPGIFQALKAWADGQIGSAGALAAYCAAPYVTIWDDQDAPYPQHPYAVLKLLRPFSTIGGKPDRSLINNGSSPDTSRRELDVEGAVRIELFSRTGLNPTSGVDETLLLIGALQQSMWTQTILDAFSAAGIALVTQSDPVKVPVVQGFGFERRAYFDTVFRARSRVDYTGAYTLEVSSVDVSGSIDPDTGAVDGAIGG